MGRFMRDRDQANTAPQQDARQFFGQSETSDRAFEFVSVDPTHDGDRRPGRRAPKLDDREALVGMARQRDASAGVRSHATERIREWTA